MDVNEQLRISAPLPMASYSLHSCDPSKVFHDSQTMRHPLAVYNVSLMTVTKRFENVLDELESLKIDLSEKQPLKANSDHSLLEATDHLLDALMEHMEDCERIVGSFFMDPSLKKNRKKIDVYKKKVDPYRDYIGKIDNFIKHHQGRLRMIAFYDSKNFYPGYYVEGLVSPGVLGPAPLIHPNSNTAFSYSRDLRFHISNLFGVSRHLSTTIRDLGAFLDPIVPSTSPTHDQWLRVLGRIADLSQMCFPDEVKKPFPTIKITGDELLIKFPDNSCLRSSFHEGIKVMGSFEGDGVTKTFKLPYMGTSNA